jgi:hypothetical protein
MRIVAIDNLTGLTPEQRELAARHGFWPDEDEQRRMRAYWLDEGHVMIAPWNPAIEPGMEVVAERSVGAAFTDTVCVHWAAALDKR